MLGEGTKIADSQVLLEEHRAEQLQFVDNLLKQLNVCIYGVDLKTYEVVFLNDQPSCFLGLEVGDICYRALRDMEEPCPDCPLQLLEDGRENAVQELYYAKSGGWSETLASLIDWQDGRRIGLLSSYNITHYHADRAKLEMISRHVPGGMMGAYWEQGMPLYFINEQMLAYLGYADEAALREATGGHLAEVIAPEERQEQLEQMSAQLESQGEYEMMSCKIKQDGTPTWMREVGRKLTLADGRTVIVCLCVDMTEQVALRNQLELYRAASRGGAFLVRIDEEFTLLYGNDIFYSVHGYTQESMAERLDNKCARYVHPDDLPGVRRVIDEARSAGETTVQWEMRVITAQGDIRWLLVTGTFEYRGGQQVLSGFITDISDNHALQEAIMRNEQRYRIALRQTPINVWEYDLAARRILLTESAEARHGYKGIVDDVPESPIALERIHPSSVADFRALYQKLFDGEPWAQADILLRTTEDEPWWWERISYTTIFDEQGKPVRAVAVGEDITRQKEAEIRYQQELELRYTFSEGILRGACINLNRDQVERLQVMNEPEAQPVQGMNYQGLIDLTAQTIINPNDRKRYLDSFSKEAVLKAYANGEKTLSMDFRQQEPSGRLRWINVTTRLVKHSLTGELYAYSSLRDIDEQKMRESALMQRAEKDMATNTYSRETAKRMMTDALTLAEQEASPYGLLIFAVDHYGQIISRSGYDVAEEIIRELSDLIHFTFGSEQIVGRFYADELVIFLRVHYSAGELLALAEKICRQMNKPFMFSEAQLPVSVSAGAAYGQWRTQDFRALYERARVALDDARKAGVGCCTLYSDDIQEGTADDLAEKDAVKEELLDEAARAKLLECVFALTDPLEWSEAITAVLQKLAAYYGAERAYLAIPMDDGRSASFYEWRQEGAVSKETLKTRLRRPEQLSADERAQLCRVVALDDLHALETKRPELYRSLQAQGVCACYMLSLLDSENKIIAYLGVDNPSRNRGRLEFLTALRQFLSSNLSRRLIEQEQAYLSNHDELTGLWNLHSFQKYQQSLQEESLISLGVAAVDINGLKRINNHYGHTFGDDVIRQTARMLQDIFAEGRAYRFAGDEFLVVCENLSLEKFEQHISELREQMQMIYPDCLSIGHAWADSEIHLSSLMAHSDERMLVAKQTYHKDLSVLTKGHDPLLRQNLQRDIEQGVFRLFLQPKADVTTGRIVGAEALVRGYRPESGLIAPDKFVPMLEKEGLIRYIDLFMFEEVCRSLQSWQAQGLALIPVSVNFSRVTLLEEQLVQEMEAIRRAYGVDARYIEIEMTESLGELERDTLAHIGRQIRLQGYGLALDDFGARYSSMAILSVMTFDVLKLDKTLVNDLISNQATRIIVRNFLTTCHELGIHSVAEGVEEDEQLQILGELGCDEAQGYYFNKPLPKAEFEKLYLHEKR